MPSMILTAPTTGAPDAAKTLPLTENVVGPGGVGLAQAVTETIRATSATRRVMRLSYELGTLDQVRPSLAALRLNRRKKTDAPPPNNVGPWPASPGCTTNSYSSINPSSAKAYGRSKVRLVS